MDKEQRIARASSLHAQGCNCCQAVLLSFADELPVDADTASNLAAPFGRGLAGTREVCGCVSAMAMACGLTGRADQARQLIERFRAEEGDIVCSRLLASGKKPCRAMIADAAGILHNEIV